MAKWGTFSTCLEALNVGQVFNLPAETQRGAGFQPAQMDSATPIQSITRCRYGCWAVCRQEAGYKPAPRRQEAGYKPAPRRWEAGYKPAPRQQEAGCKPAPRRWEAGYKPAPRLQEAGCKPAPL
jgi:hypothetical protein